MPIRPRAGQKVGARVKGAAPGGENRSRRIPVLRMGTASWFGGKGYAQVFKLAGQPARRGNRPCVLLPQICRNTGDLGGVIHTRGEVDAPPTGARPSQFDLTAAATLLGLRMRQFIDIGAA